MKISKILMSVALLACVAVLGSCKDDKDSPDKWTDTYFEAADGKFNAGAIPESTVSSELDDVEYNAQALRGGSNFFIITTDEPMKEFYLGVKGENGYYTVPAVATRAQGNNYMLSITYGAKVNERMIMTLSGCTSEGNVFKSRDIDVKFVESAEGALEVNLTFSNAKDIDLHLFTPSGIHICYWNRGFDIYDGDEIVGRYGLDHDSNAGCYIDNLNNENIVIPQEYVENGEYRVYVDLYENCKKDIATSWKVVTRYKGSMVNAISGKNPAYGEFPVGAPSSGENNLQLVTVFKISGSNGHAPVIDSDSYDIRRADGRRMIRTMPKTEAEIAKYKIKMM